MAVQGVSSEFDYFTPQVFDSTIEECFNDRISSKSALSPGQPIEFVIQPQDHAYRDLNSSVLEVCCRVVKKDDAALTATDAVAPVNLFLHSLFKEVEIYIGGTKITDSCVYYAERSYLETLLSQSKAALDMRGRLEGWCKDDGLRMNKFLLKDGTAADEKANSGFVERSKWIKESQEVQLVGRIHADIFHQPLDIPPGLQIIVKLIPAPSEKVLLAAADNYKVVLTAAHLNVKTKRVSPDLELAHQKMMIDQKAEMIIPYVHVTMLRLGTGTNNTSFVANDFYSGRKPSRITVVFVKTSALDGTIGENPYYFPSLSLKEMYLKVAGKDKIPNETILMDFATGCYQHAYLNTLAALNFDQGNQAISLTPEDWATGYNVHVFKLVPNAVATGVNHPTNYEHVSLSLQANFNAVIQSTYTALALIEQPATLLIDEHKKVTVVA